MSILGKPDFEKKLKDLEAKAGKGAVVEGRIGRDGVFQATTIMAKHAEEYSPHLDGKAPAKSFIPAQEAGAK